MNTLVHTFSFSQMSSGLKELDAAIAEASKPHGKSSTPQPSQTEAKDEKDEKGGKGGKGGKGAKGGKDAKDAKKPDKTKVSYWSFIAPTNRIMMCGCVKEATTEYNTKAYLRLICIISYILFITIYVISFRAGHQQ